MRLWSGVGLVAANMIGTGVFVSAGFMAQAMSAGWILLAWIVGAALAMTGAFAYAAVARRVPRSGGEYRYLSELLHPAVGYLAGWASLLVGFAAPVALSAVAAALYLDTVVDLGPPRGVAATLIAGLTLFHSLSLRSSQRTQNGLVLCKVALVVGFLLLGLSAGSHAWPSWSPPGGDGAPPLEGFAGSLFWVAFAFSGWNAAAYAAAEFERPERTVPRAMLIGCGGVGLLYLGINWVFVANLTPSQASAVTDPEAVITLGHLVTEELVGEAGGALMSVVTAIVMVSSMSAMTLVGPRVYAAMAEDGYLPRVLAARAGRPPAGAVFLQGAIALLLVFSHSVRQVLQNVGAVLVLFTALTCVGLLRARPRPPRLALAAAAIYAGASAWMLYFGFRDDPTLALWLAATAACALAGYIATRGRAMPEGR